MQTKPLMRSITLNQQYSICKKNQPTNIKEDFLPTPSILSILHTSFMPDWYGVISCLNSFIAERNVKIVILSIKNPQQCTGHFSCDIIQIFSMSFTPHFYIFSNLCAEFWQRLYRQLMQVFFYPLVWPFSSSLGRTPSAFSTLDPLPGPIPQASGAISGPGPAPSAVTWLHLLCSLKPDTTTQALWSHFTTTSTTTPPALCSNLPPPHQLYMAT